MAEDAAGCVQSAADLAMMPPEIAESIRSDSIGKLRKLLYPRAILRARRRLCAFATKQAVQSAVAVTVDVMKSFEGFAEWPTDVLERVVSKARYSLF